VSAWVAVGGICLKREIWADSSGRIAFEIRRGQQVDWSAGWFDPPVDLT
jgi:hypothetical protein